MPRVRIIETTAALWGVPPGMPGVLRASGAVGTPKQETSVRDAGRDSPVSGRAWPGRGSGVRGPGIDETPLSACEVAYGQMKGLL